MTAHLSLGVAGTLDHGLIRDLAPAMEAAGFHALWVNDGSPGDTRTGGPLAALAAAASVTSTLVLATGVIPIDRRTADAIAADVEGLGLPQERLVIGIGSGGLRVGALDTMARAIDDLHAATRARIVLGALGPKMRELGFSHADGSLLSWFTPEAAIAATRDRPPGTAILYARSMAEEPARARLEGEAARYASYRQYAAHFARSGIEPLAATIDLTSGPERLASFRAAVDEVVLRAITPSDALDEYLRFLVAVR
jgi:alkanesulfonate monooxygenase SsuD/methylene tetrahydromethanopterin reductase-like flavin-dependent oxidoreductase (luciferase family)